jgi:hypothetical protein
MWYYAQPLLLLFVLAVPTAPALVLAPAALAAVLLLSLLLLLPSLPLQHSPSPAQVGFDNDDNNNFSAGPAAPLDNNNNIPAGPASPGIIIPALPAR